MHVAGSVAKRQIDVARRRAGQAGQVARCLGKTRGERAEAICRFAPLQDDRPDGKHRFVELTDDVFDSSHCARPTGQSVAQQDAGGKDPLDQAVQVPGSVFRGGEDASRVCFV